MADQLRALGDYDIPVRLNVAGGLREYLVTRLRFLCVYRLAQHRVQGGAVAQRAARSRGARGIGLRTFLRVLIIVFPVVWICRLARVAVGIFFRRLLRVPLVVLV